MSDIIIDPTNTDIMYLATGDADGGDTYSIGILKSIDGGLTWDSLSATATNTPQSFDDDFANFSEPTGFASSVSSFIDNISIFHTGNIMSPLGPGSWMQDLGFWMQHPGYSFARETCWSPSIGLQKY